MAVAFKIRSRLCGDRESDKHGVVLVSEGSLDTTVLVVDDEQRLADLFATWLERHYDVRTAYDGQEALDAFDDAVDIVLLDRRMPGLSGDAVLAELRDRNEAVQVAMVTAVDPDFDIIDLGFDDYLVKPVSREDLKAVVERMGIRASYDRKIREYYGLAAKRALLESEKPPSELADNEEYQQLLGELDALQEGVDEAIERMSSHEEFVKAFWRLDPGAHEVGDEADQRC